MKIYIFLQQSPKAWGMLTLRIPATQFFHHSVVDRIGAAGNRPKKAPARYDSRQRWDQNRPVAQERRGSGGHGCLPREEKAALGGEGRELAEHHLEIRGLGLIDTRSTFGIRAVRAHKRLEVEVKLVDFDPDEEYDRTGLDEQYTTILGVKIPLIVLPMNPGKNITVIAETIALNQLLKIYGHHTPKEFNKKLIAQMRKKERNHIQELKTRDFLDKDFEWYGWYCYMS